MLTLVPLENVANQVVLMQALHNQHDRAVPFVVEPAQQRVVKPFVHRFTLGLGHGFRWFHRVINEDRASAAPG